MSAPDTSRALTAEEFEQHCRNGQAADWQLVARMIVTLKHMFIIENMARLLVSKNPGTYSSLELALGALEMRRQP